MSQLIVLGDTHFDIKEPFFSAQKEFCNWFLGQEFNKEENILIHLGDVYHHSNPNPKVHDMGIDFFSKMKFNRKYILAGNHDYNRAQNSYSIEPLSKIKNTELVFSKEYFPNFLNSGINFILMPFIYDKSDYSKIKYSEKGILVEKQLSQKEYYEILVERPEIFDYLFFHFEDETISFSGEYSGINLKQFKNAERIGGHIHIRNKNYLGTPYVTRYDEKGKDSYILTIDLETKKKEYIKVPQFLDYVEIDYEVNKDVSEAYKSSALHMFDHNNNEIFAIYDVINCPSKQSAEEKFKGLYLREIKLKKNEGENSDLSQGEEDNKTLKDHFNEFCVKNKVSKDIQEKVLNYIF